MWPRPTRRSKSPRNSHALEGRAHQCRNGFLTFKGEKKAEKEEKNKNYYTVESYGSFSRSLQLPSGIDADKVS
jgi:HSP20 family molecular chaperone IbpA